MITAWLPMKCIDQIATDPIVEAAAMSRYLHEISFGNDTNCLLRLLPIVATMDTSSPVK